MDRLNRKLQNPKETQFVIVALPTRLWIDETKRLILISSSPSFDTEKFQLPRLPIVAR